MIQSLRRLFSSDDAATAVEYAVMLALILLVCFSAIAVVGSQTLQSWTNSNDSLKAVNFGS